MIVDRLSVKANAKQRLTDSVETALRLADGLVVLDFVDLPDDELSLADGAIAPWAIGQSAEYFTRLLTALSEQVGFRMDAPWRKLSARVQKAVLHGSDDQVHVR